MIRLHRSTEHRAYALWACPRAVINSQRPPPAATCEHEAGAGLQSASNAENTLVMRRSVAHFSCRHAPSVATLPSRAACRSRGRAARPALALEGLVLHCPAIGCAEPRPDVHSYG